MILGKFSPVLHKKNNKKTKKKQNKNKKHACSFVLRFYGPVNPVGSFRARSVYLTTF